jgi:hypothetical protein
VSRRTLTRAQLEGVAALNVCPPLIWACDWPRRRGSWAAWLPIAAVGVALAAGAVLR